MRVLGIIPARGNSKGIPRKNVALVAGKPLLYFTVRAALASKNLTRTVLSSDDPEIISLAQSLGVDAPFVRPAHLASDEASSRSVAQHALHYVEDDEQCEYDAICLLQPTCPLREAEDIDSAIDVLSVSDADSVVSVTRVEEPHPLKMMVIHDEVVRPLFPSEWRETLRRQELRPVFYLNGAVYCTRRSVLVERGSLWGSKTLPYVMPAERSINIDRPVDLKIAELTLTPTCP